MLTPKNKALLKGLSNHLDPIVTVGKGEIDESLLASLNNALKSHELVKVRVLNNSGKELEDVATQLAEKSKSEVVATLGHIVLLYRANKDHPIIVLG